MATQEKLKETGTKNSAGRFNTQEVVRQINAGIDDSATNEANIATNTADIATNTAAIAAPTLNTISLTADQSGGTLTLTAAQSGSLINLDDADGAAIVLPTIATGLYFDFQTTTELASNTITIAPASPDPEFVSGGVVMMDADLDDNSRLFKSSDEEVFTINGTSKGGRRGTAFRVAVINATTWNITGILACNTTPVSPWGV